MALVRTKHCDRCGHITLHTDNVCDPCLQKARDIKTKQVELIWQGIPVEQQVLILRKRVETLEEELRRVRNLRP